MYIFALVYQFAHLALQFCNALHEKIFPAYNAYCTLAK